MKAKRQMWRAQTPTIDPRRLVCLDESGAKTNMTRLRGRAAKGRRVYDHTPHGPWCTTTMLGAIRLEGVIESACLMYQGATDAAVFLTYVQRRLAPNLKPGDIVVMDNLSSHRVKGIREAIEAVGAQRWYLPPYRPDYNPIENVGSKVKTTLRPIAARTIDALQDAIGEALRTISASDILSSFKACGYDPSTWKTL